jgi:Fe2+ or Zn2+ uptake regulation protein
MKKIIAQKKYRNGKIRLGIIKFLQVIKKPASAGEILQALKKQNHSANKTSIYRGIEIIIEQGQAREADFGDGIKRYESASLKHHHHLICTECKRVEDIYVRKEALMAIEKNIAKQNSFAEVKHSLEFFGVCNKCL